MPKPIIRYKHGSLDRNSVGSDYIIGLYKNDGEPLEPVGAVMEAKWNTKGELIRFETDVAIYVQVKS